MDGNEFRKKLISILIKETIGKEIEITSEILKVYRKFTTKELTIPIIDILREQGLTGGQIAKRIGADRQRVYYVLTREFKPKKEK